MMSYVREIIDLGKRMLCSSLGIVREVRDGDEVELFARQKCGSRLNRCVWSRAVV